jgi:hypothetical protein
MKAGLKLTEEQANNWPAFEAAIHNAAKARADRLQQTRDRMNQAERPSPIERMSLLANHLEKAGLELQNVADAGKPLYDSLTDVQKRDFGPLIHQFKPSGQH